MHNNFSTYLVINILYTQLASNLATYLAKYIASCIMEATV